MKKHITAGPTGLTRIRSLVAFRHHNPVARFVSTLLAFAIAMLLAVGPSAAYADGTAPDPAVTQATDPAPDAGSGDASTTDATPAADETAPSSSDGTTTDAPDASTDTSSTSTESSATGPTAPAGPMMTTLKTLAIAPALDGTTVDAPCNYNAPSAIAVPAGKFEIDGNLCLTGDPTTPAAAVGDADWDSLAYDDPTTGAYKIDELGDSSGFTEGSAETSNPQGWVGGHTPNSKNDIETAWGYSQAIGSDVYAYFGFTSSSQAGGTQQVNMEYNQKDPVPNAAGNLDVPDRTVGDLLFHFSMNGSSPLSFTTVLAWTLQSSGWVSSGPNACTAVAGYSPAAGWCPVTGTPASAFHSAVSSNGQFAEGSIDISALSIFTGKCSGEFGTMQMRTTTGNSWTSALKDYVGPLTVTTPSNCGKILINKVDENGNRLPGATFSVSPNPDPSLANNVAYSITDNDAKDKDSRPGYIEINPVDPTAPNNVYTVTETGAPTPAGSYMIDNPLGTSTNPQTVGVNGTATFNFVDHRIWKGLTAVKSANPTYRAIYHWSVNKEISADGTSGWTTSTTSASPLEKDVAPDATDASKLFYRVTATEGARTTDLYKVSGTIDVSNPADNVGAMDAVVTDSLPGATCTVDGGTSKSINVAKGAIVHVPYVCTFTGTPTADQLAGTNTAHVTWDRSTYPQVVGDLTDVGGTTRHVDPTAAYNFANAVVTDVDRTVTVTDNKHTFVPAWTLAWSSQGATHASDVYSQTASVTPGSCSAVVDNTATITGSTTGVLDTDSAYGKVCQGADLVVSKNKTVDMTRTYLWKIDKSTDDTQIVSGQSASYSVTVSRGDGDGFQDSGWTMDGVVTVTNPNDWQSVTMSSLVDHYSGDKDANNSCHIVGSRVPPATTWGAVDLSLDPSQVMEYKYHCEFTAKPDYTGTNTATATWNAAAAHTTPDAGSANSTSAGTASVVDNDWTTAADPVNRTITVTDDHYDDGHGGHVLGTVDWVTGAPHTFTYSIPWTAPAGQCETKDNTATIVETGQHDSASVLVCNPKALTLDKTATGHFDRTYHWSIDKLVSADPESDSAEWTDADTWTGPSFSHQFGYLVRLSQEPWTDGAFTITGTITVTNPNTDSRIAGIGSEITDAPDVGAAASCFVDGGTDDGTPLVGYGVGPIASGGHVDVDYRCTVADLATGQYTGGTNVVTATNASNSPFDKSVTFTKAGEIDKTVTVKDDKVSLSTPATLGSKTYDEAHPAATYDFAYDLTNTATTTRCQNFVNTAKVWGDDATTALDQASATATICPSPGTWTVSKTSDVGDGPVPTDSDITYTLTAHKTGGVNPTNVVLYDDLSPLAPYVDLPTLADLQAAAPAGSTVELTGNLITWTIDELGSTDATLDFTVHVKPDADGVDLPNLVTSPGSNCPDAAHVTAACDTDNDTPHYTLAKSSDPASGSQVMPPYLGHPGTLITYTLTVHNDSDAPINGTTMPGEKVTDDLSDVLDNAAWVGNITGDGDASFDNDHTLTWTLPDIPVDGTVTLSYQVRVAGDQWDETLTNVAHQGPGGDCLPVEGVLIDLTNANCTTTTVTPPYALIQALKVDADTGAPLPGAEFALSDGETVLDTGTSNAQGLVTFTTKLQPGTFTVTETKAPADYSLPATTSQDVTVTSDDLDNGEVPVRVTFADPPTGSLLITKAHQERSGSSWVPGDGTVNFGDEIKYVMTVTSTGPKVFHDVAVTDYVPGYGPNAGNTQPAGTKAELEASTITCGGAVTCTTSYDAATGLITWHLTGAGDDTGDVQGDVGTVEFVVRMPNLPATSPLAGPGVSFAALLWNQASLAWTQVDVPEQTQHQDSNAVTDSANATLPPKVIPPKPPQVSPPAVLPNTGGPSSWLLGAGVILLLGGGTLIAADRRRKHRS